jgi:putative oxidoreductase
MEKHLDRPGLGLLVLRVVAASFMLTHGWPKLQKIFAGDWTFADPVGIGEGPSLLLAALAEFGGSVLVLIGWKARLAAIPVVFTMLVAGILVHANDPWAKKELALLYGACFAAVVFLGAGRYSVDGWREGAGKTDGAAAG